MSAGRIDTSSRRWVVAVHEAAHVVAAEHLGWTVRYARINPDGDSGEMDDHPPSGLDSREQHIQDAVIALAGPCASARMRWFLPRGCHHDERHARTRLAGTGITYSQAKHQARKVVDRHWSRIQRLARRLYREEEL